MFMFVQRYSLATAMSIAKTCYNLAQVSEKQQTLFKFIEFLMKIMHDLLSQSQ